MITHSDCELDSERMSLYYGHYRYRLSLDIPDIGWFRDADTEERYQKSANRHFRNMGVSIGNSLTSRVTDWRIVSDPAQYRLRCQRGTICVYTNDLGIINDLVDRFDQDDLDFIRARYHRCEESDQYERGVVFQVQPKHRYRIYIKSRKFSHEERARLYEFLKDKVYPSPSFNNWLQQDAATWTWGLTSGFWAWPNFFFDYDDERLSSFMVLKFDDIIGKVCEIRKKINT